MRVKDNPTALIAVIGLAFLAGSVLAAQPTINSVRPNRTELGRFEKFELKISLESAFDNPFDPDQVDLGAEFTAPSGKKWNIWGFYNPGDWNSLWMVRFTPDETGSWSYVVKVTDSQGAAESGEGRFSVTDSPRHGFLKIAPNRRYLEYNDGTSFYGIGMWYNDSYEEFGRGQITEAGLDELKKYGAGFISFFPTPLETMGTGLGRYDQNRCGRMDQLFEWCEKRDMHISWNVWFHSYISEKIWGGGNARYRFTPYKLACRAVDFFQDSTAWTYQEKLYRYMIARWGYSPSLFLWFVVDEIDGTEGWVEGDTTKAAEWSKKVHNYFKEHDPCNRPTTGTRCGAFKSYWPAGYEIFDIAAREIYEAQGFPMPKSGKVTAQSESPLQASYRNYAGEIRKLWNSYKKPLILGETGWDHTYYEPGMPGYLATYHNILWVSLTTGLSMSPFWWAHSEWINDAVVTNQWLSLSRFVSDIDFAGLDPVPADISADSGCDAYGIRSGDKIFGWIVNPKESAANARFTVKGLPDGEYEVQLYRTWRGEYLEKHTVACSGGKLVDTIPELLTARGHANHIGNDVAVKIERKK